MLILSDHGGGWTGGWSDDDPEYGSGLTMQEIDDALGAIVADTGIGAFELVGFDACLMGQLEVMSAVAPHARYAVGSEETEPSLGWGYAEFLRALTAGPGHDRARTGAGHRGQLRRWTMSASPTIRRAACSPAATSAPIPWPLR